MFKKEFLSHFLATITWLVIISLLRWNWYLDLIWLWLGGLLGTFLFDIDHWLYLLVVNPHELTSQRVKHLFDQKRFKEASSLVVSTTQERIRLPFHNALFQVILYILCFFVLTSTNNLLGAGLVMGMALHLLKDEFHGLFKEEERFGDWLFWPLRVDVSRQNQKFFVILMLLIFLGLNLLLI